jgi:hypothetical protein
VKEKEREKKTIEDALFSRELSEKLTILQHQRESSQAETTSHSSLADTLPSRACVNTLPNVDDEVIGVCNCCSKDVMRGPGSLMSDTHVFHRPCYHRNIRAVVCPVDYTATTIRTSFDRDNYVPFPPKCPKDCPVYPCRARIPNLSELLAHMRANHPQKECEDCCIRLGGVKCTHCGKIYPPKSIKQHIGRKYKTTRTTGKKRKTPPTTNTDDDDEDDDDDEGGDSDDNPERPPPPRAHTYMLQGPVDTPMTRDEMARARAIRYATNPSGHGTISSGMPTATAPDPRALELVYTYSR